MYCGLYQVLVDLPKPGGNEKANADESDREASKPECGCERRSDRHEPSHNGKVEQTKSPDIAVTNGFGEKCGGQYLKKTPHDLLSRPQRADHRCVKRKPATPQHRGSEGYAVPKR